MSAEHPRETKLPIGAQAAAHRARPFAGGGVASALPPLLLLLATLGLILAGAARARPGVELAADAGDAGRTLVRFYGVEANATDSYRWSEPLAGVFLYGYEGRPAIATLRLTAPRPAGEAPVEVAARAGGVELGRFTVGGDWREYHLLAPTRPAGETALLLETAAFVPEGDPRELGVALSHVRLGPTDAHSTPPPARALFLLALPLLGWLLLRRLAAPPWAAAGAGALLALAAGWAAAFPTASGYWLPTLGWPWWPLLPLLLLAGWPRLRIALAAGRAWLDGRPALAWAGLAVALAAIIGMRLGLPWPVGMGLLAAGVCAGLSNVECRTQKAAAEPASRLMLLGALGITAVALLLRLWNLDGQPAGLWRDESRHGLQALLIWSDPSYRPVYVVEGADLPALLFYLMAPVVGLLGPHAWSARLVSALAGALTPLALYWAAAPLIGRRAALLGAALLAWASWGLSMSRWAFPATLDHLLVLMAVGLLWRGIENTVPFGDAYGISEADAQRLPSRLRAFNSQLSILNAQLPFALAGLLAGLAVYAYHTGRVAPLALGAVAAIRLGRSWAAWRRALPGLAAAALAGALTLAPLAVYLLSDLDGYNRRVGSVSLLDSNDPRTHTPAGLLLDNLGRYLLMFHVRGDANGRHHMPAAPMLDPVAGLLLALGLGVALAAARRRPGVAAVLALGAVYLIPGVFSGNAPHAMRSLGTLAPAAMLAGLGLAAMLGAQSAKRKAQNGLANRRAAPRSSGAPRFALYALTLSASLAFNLWLYFGIMRMEPLVYGEFDMVETAMGRIAAAPFRSDDQELQAVRVYLPERLRDADTVAFLTWDLPTYAYPGEPLPADGPALVLLPGDASAEAQAEALAALGPGAAALGPTPAYPDSGQPIILAFGRGAAAAELLAAGDR